jgi:AraC-like DNA-binding protein
MVGNMAPTLDNVTFGQAGGGQPDLLLAARSAGEHGVGLAELRFAGGAFAKGSASHHLLVFQLGSPARVSCRVNNKSLEHVAPGGNITICPADSDFAAENGDSLKTLIFIIPKEPLACLSAEHAEPKAALLEKLSGCVTLAEVAAATGFVDQSHLCRWIKRVDGASPARLTSAARQPG